MYRGVPLGEGTSLQNAYMFHKNFLESCLNKTHWHAECFLNFFKIREVPTCIAVCHWGKAPPYETRICFTRAFLESFLNKMHWHAEYFLNFFKIREVPTCIAVYHLGEGTSLQNP